MKEVFFFFESFVRRKINRKKHALALSRCVNKNQLAFTFLLFESPSLSL